MTAGTRFSADGVLSLLNGVDAEFWRLHTAWRRLEDEAETFPEWPDESPVAQVMLDQATAARDAMFAQPVNSAAAVLAKFEACREGGAAGLMGTDLPTGASVFRAIMRDVESMAAREAGGC